MYELLLQWGLQSLTQLTGLKNSNDMSIMLEAIKAKNALVIERFKFAWEACQSVVDLTIEVESELAQFEKEIQKNISTKPDRLAIHLRMLKHDFHPNYYRQLKKIRSRFESTNDLLSSYSKTMVGIVHFSMVEDIVKKKKLKSPSDINYAYRGVWTLYSEILISLVRLTSNDLRFWLTDTPFVIKADRWADKDFENVSNFLTADDWGGNWFHLSLENEYGLQEFWKEK